MGRSLAALSRGILLLLFALVAAAPSAAAADKPVETAWRLLDYLSVDYAGAVRNGRVISQSEYGEMREFSASVTQRLQALPANPNKPSLISKSRALEGAIAGRSGAGEVAGQARSLGAALLAAYPVPLAPKVVPDVSRGARLYAETCAACHGSSGRADTPAAKALDPQPVAFADRGRARERTTVAPY